MLFALAMPAVLVAGAGAVEVSEAMWAKNSLQSIVDGAALNGAQQISADRSAATKDRVQAQADALARALYPRWTINTTVRIDPVARTVTVTQNSTRPSLFGSLFQAMNVAVSATASQGAQTPMCVLGIQGRSKDVVRLQDSAAITAGQCLVQSNSDINVSGSAASLRAGAVRSVTAANGSISPPPVTDAPSMADPFANLAINVPTKCTDNGITLTEGTQVLNPGVHCGNISVASGAKLVLNPGEHYFLNGTMSFSGKGQLVGEDVVLIFKNGAMTKPPKTSGGGDDDDDDDDEGGGQSSSPVATLSDNAIISLDGRKSGPYSGFVIITDRSLTTGFSISTDNARVLHGTIYLPRAALQVSGTASRVGDKSPWTLVVANKVSVAGSADLVINASYGSSVPVPPSAGLNGASRLVR